ncbi:MAG: hypothetical protein IJK84_09765 [Bacteroidales bacterium]|nr:hypothetical protein [Bacteroidales bacterium]
MEKKTKYCKPEIEVMNARIERGYFLSAGNERLEEQGTVDNSNFRFN